MAAILALLKALRQSTDNICVGTTSYVAEDRSSKLIELVNSISADIPIYSSDLHMIESIKPGLQAFARGFVKEGVGAGGVSITSMLKSNDNINGTDLLKAIEQEYEKVIERTVV
jgi:NaMN:DMB phosphoribosyltransferase